MRVEVEQRGGETARLPQVQELRLAERKEATDGEAVAVVGAQENTKERVRE